MTRSIQLGGYSAHVAAGLLDEAGSIIKRDAPAHRYAIITDDVVGPLYASRTSEAIGADRCSVLTVPTGETHKTRETWAQLTDTLVEQGHGRDTTLVALGGGVIGDLAGFVAATFLRGIPYINVPTTLVAMVDAAVGGKTGVDTGAGKNLVGAFHRPACVIADPRTLRTLSDRHVRSGMAEALKHGIVADARYFELVASCAEEVPVDSDRMVELIAGSISIKGEIVKRDEYELGRRKVLNFGHTLGHAVEFQSKYRLFHGEAVSIGMALEAEIAERVGIAQPGTASSIRAALTMAGLPSDYPTELDSKGLLAATRVDKKARRGVVEYALPKCIGEMAGAETGWAIPISDVTVLEVLG
ncbi:MAG: 3-dehydroquinate synthase [Anaerolineae bacterium]|nr:3-dehydroquinate synthase [Gemmatimonadaceae bacterium]